MIQASAFICAQKAAPAVPVPRYSAMILLYLNPLQRTGKDAPEFLIE
jgi:hypothetical protein